MNKYIFNNIITITTLPNMDNILRSSIPYLHNQFHIIKQFHIIVENCNCVTSHIYISTLFEIVQNRLSTAIKQLNYTIDFTIATYKMVIELLLSLNITVNVTRNMILQPLLKI